MKSRILVIDDNPTMREGIIEVVSKMGHEVISCSNGTEGLNRFNKDPFDFVIVDLKMSGMSGIEILRKIKGSNKDTVVMMMTAYGNIETAVEAMKLGAFDFVTKPFTPDLLRLKVDKALEISRANKQYKGPVNENIRINEGPNTAANKIVGNSPAIKKILGEIKKSADSGSAVLITGENGTGKELAAREIHNLSPRKNKPFVKIDCASIPKEYFETGRLELADGGTLFLDEIAALPSMIQPKILRLLQDGEFERPASNETIKTDIRIIAASSADLANEVEENKFRKDLYYRLNILSIHMPPLTKRIEDIAELSKHFLSRLCKKTGKKVKRLGKKALAMLRSYNWPGNIRELEAVIERACVLSEGNAITPNDLPLTVLKPNLAGRVPVYTGIPLSEYLGEIEKNLIETALKENKGVKTRTAKKLGIKTSLLYYKLEKYGLDKIEFGKP